MNISKISVKRPIAVTMVVLIFVVIGLYSLSMFSIELMPRMELSMAVVYTSYPNVGSQEVENLVTNKQESIALLGVVELRIVAHCHPLGLDMPEIFGEVATKLNRGLRVSIEEDTTHLLDWAIAHNNHRAHLVESTYTVVGNYLSIRE